MVTLDDTIVNVGTFKGDLKVGRRDYERARQGLELITVEKSSLEEALKRHTGFVGLDIPPETVQTPISRGDVKFIITSQATTARPSYKTAVEGMENYLAGVYFLLVQGMKIDRVFQRSKLTFIDVSKLLEAFQIIVGAIFEPSVKHTIQYEVAGELADEKALDELLLREGRNPSALTAENFANYVRMDGLEPILAAYAKSYETELVKGQRKAEETTPVTSKSAYTTKKSKSEGPDWNRVVRTLISVPTHPDTLGELNILDDPNLSKAEKERRFPYYTLTYGSEKDQKVLYISIQNVYTRIQTLKEGPSIKAKRLKVEPKEIV